MTKTQNCQQEFQEDLACPKKGKLAVVKKIYEAFFLQNHEYFDALHLLGASTLLSGRVDLSIRLLRKAIRINPDYAPAYNSLGNALRAFNSLDEALLNYEKAIQLNPDFAEAFNNHGNTLKDLKRFDKSLTSYDRAIALDPIYADAFKNRADALKDLKRLDEALINYEKAIALNPDFAEAFNHHGTILKYMKRIDEALISYEKAIALNPNYADAFKNRGDALKDSEQLDDALTNYKKAIALKPDFAEAYSNLGVVLGRLKFFDEALKNHILAIELKPGFAEAYRNIGDLLFNYNSLTAALASYDAAISLQPNYAEAWRGRGHVLYFLKQFDKAISSYEKAMSLKPELEFIAGDLCHTRLNICDWSAYNSEVAKIIEAVGRSEKGCEPHTSLVISHSRGVQLKAAMIFDNSKTWVGNKLAIAPKHKKRDKILVGYFSADFHNHATMYLAAELFERRNRANFELVAFSFGPSANDKYRQRAQNAFDKFIDVNTMSDADVARLARKLAIDIAIDLKGFTKGARTNIFGFRAAPIQVNYLGYPGTMGTDFIDYIIADPTLIPVSHQKYYSEKVVYLPHSYQPNDRKRVVSDRIFSRQEVGLPDRGFVFCCFNNNYKITPDVFDIWMRILKRVEGSVLWLLLDNSIAATNLGKEASARGVDQQRLIFAPRMPLAEHLARHRLADLFLDTLPCNAHTTASDALWAGLPVVTQIGETFAGRVAASLLTAIGLPELITDRPESYEAMAIELAIHPEKLVGIKNKLAANRLTTPLFDTGLFAKHVEAAYTAMYERYHADLPPDHIFVEP